MPPQSRPHDPYRKFKFRIKIGSDYVAGLTKCSALAISVESQDHRTGDDESFKRKLPGLVSYDAITLEQGVTSDTTFEKWATAMSNYVGNKGSDAEKTPDSFRKDIEIEVYDLDNKKVKAYKVYNCWVSKYTAIPDLDAGSSDVLIQTLELQNEGIRVLM